MKSFTNRAKRWRGNTVVVTVRLPHPVVDFMDSHLDTKFIRNRSEFLQHWATVGMMAMENAELMEALDWALAQAEAPLPTILDAPMVPEPLDDPAFEEPERPRVDTENATVTFTPRTIPAQPDPLAATYEEILESLRSKIR